jgi:hypothetical protein
MKNTLKYLLLFALVSVFTACEKDPIDSLSGEYPAPENYTLNLLSQDVQKGATTRTFTLELGNSSQYLAVEFVGSRLNYFLAPGNYTVAEQAAARVGNYVAGYGNGGTYWVTGSSKLKLTDGTIAVKLEGGVYTITGTVMLEDHSIIKIIFTGAIIFDPDPPVMTYTLETAMPAMGGAMGTDPIASSRMNKITVFTEGMQVAYFEVITADNAISLSGSYVVTDGINATGQANNGYYLDLSEYGMGIMKGGSYYIDGTDEMFIRAGGGNIDIADNNGTLTITGSNLPIQDISTGMAFGILPARGSMNYQEVTREVAHSYTYTKTVTAPYAWTMDGQNFTPVAGSQLNTIAISDNGIPAATFEIVTEENTASLSGVFPVKAVNSLERAIVQGQYINLLWMAMFDMAIESGSRYIEGGETMYVRDGNITITDNGGVLTITGNGLSLQDVSTELAFGNLPAPGSVNYQNVTP